MWRYLPPLLVFLVFVFPVVVWIGVMGFQEPQAGLTAHLLLACLIRTHGLACLVAMLSIILAAPAALWARLSSKKIFDAMSLLIFMPVCIGMLARNHAWIGMLSQKEGWSSLGWSLIGGSSLIHTQSAVYIVMSFVFLPWAYFILQIALGAVSQLQIEAASTLGASTGGILWRVLRPALIRGAFVAFFLVYCTSLGYFITPRMVGPNSGDLAGNIIVSFVNLGDFGIASQVALSLLLSGLPFVVVFLVVVNRRRGFLSWQG
jgi:ABC-type spermidine/putrescine transport system permease subunit I